MATNSDLVSIIKTLVNLQETRKDSTATNEQQDTIESSSSENKSLERGEQLSWSTLEMAFLGLSSTVKENMKEITDFLSNKISQLEERVCSLEDVVERRFTAMENECCSSLEVISDRLSSLEENMCTETKAIAVRMSSLENSMVTKEEVKLIGEKLEEKLTSLAEMKRIEKHSTVVRLSSLEENMSTGEKTEAIAVRLSSLEDNMRTKTKAIVGRLSSLEENACTSGETKAIAERMSSLEGKMSTSGETKAIAVRMSSLENSMVTKEEVKLIGKKLEEKLTSLAKMKGIKKHSTVKEGIISREALVPQCFDSTRKGYNFVLSNDSKTAWRIRVKHDSGFGGVISKFPLKEEVVFQIVIEETNDKNKNCGFAFGVIIDKKAEVEGVPSITKNIKGTWAIESWWNSPKGKSHIYKDNFIINRNAYPLDTRNLPVGTVVGVKLRSNGDIHFLLNGSDKGVAFQNIPNNVFLFIDIANYVNKIRIV